MFFFGFLELACKDMVDDRWRSPFRATHFPFHRECSEKDVVGNPVPVLLSARVWLGIKSIFGLLFFCFFFKSTLSVLDSQVAVFSVTVADFWMAKCMEKRNDKTATGDQGCSSKRFTFLHVCLLWFSG